MVIISKFKNILCAVSVLFLLPLVSLHAAELTIYDSAESAQPLKVGDTAPTFVVQNVEGEDLSFDGNQRDKPTMFITFRGGWCPYCNNQLQDIRTVLPEISNDIDVYFLSGDRADDLYASLADKTKEEIEGLDYVILSDANMQAASALGIAFRLPDRSVERSKSRRDISGSSTGLHAALAVPSIFIIGTDGKIAYVHSEPNYKVRLSANELHDAAKAVLAK